MTVATKTNEALNNLKSKLGETIGNGQCYGLVAYYSFLLGGPALGAGITEPNPDGNGRQEPNSDTRRGMAAANLGGDYNWNAKGWVVKFDPQFSDLKVGCIVNYRNIGSDEYGHTAVIIAVGDGSYDIIEQNYAYKQYATERKNVADIEGISSIIYPPELVAGGAVGNVEAPAPSTPTGNGDIETKVFSVEGVLIDVDNLLKYTPNVFSIPNLLKIAYDDLEKALHEYTGVKDLEIEYQLLNSEFIEVELYDIYGNSYAYQSQYLPRNLDEKNNYLIIVTGSMGDSNQVHINLLQYNNANVPNYASKDIFATIDNNGTNINWQQINPEHYKYGINDITGRNLAILNDAEASYIQANKNQMEATQLTFKENKDMLKKSIDLSNKKVTSANEQASYNAKYAVESANISQWSTGISAVGNVLTNAFTGNIGGAVGGALSGTMDTWQAMRNYGNQKQLAEYTEQNNQLNKQSNALANMQAKIGLDQSIRAYNATMADMQNQPISVQQIGNDLAFQTGNKLNDVYWRVALAQKEVLNRANNYIKWYGVITNRFSNNVMAIIKERKRFNYIKMINVNLGNLQANQSHMNALQAIFQSGVRIWNYEHIQHDEELFDIQKNNPSYQ